MTRKIFVAYVCILTAFGMTAASFRLKGAPIPQTQEAPDIPPEMLQSVQQLIEKPFPSERYDYVMKAGIRLLFFWLSHDDVGDGYIRIGHEDGNNNINAIQLVMGSDPDRAPRKINRWGAVTETFNSKTGTGYLFGFIKSAKGKSIKQVEGEMKHERSGKNYYFESIVSRISDAGMQSITVPIHSSTDLNLHQIQKAEEMVFRNMRTAHTPLRSLDSRALSACGNKSGLLLTLKKIIDSILAGKKAPLHQCYFYNSEEYRLYLDRSEPKDIQTISFKRGKHMEIFKATYRNLINTDMRILNTETGEITNFSLLLGTEGRYRGIPVQIRYQPEWWLRVTLNLYPGDRDGSGNPGNNK